MGKVNGKCEKNYMQEGEVADAFRAFGFVHRGGSRPRPLNMRFCDRLNNTQFAAEDHLFRQACNLAGIQPTKRQASKWRNKKGTAYQFKSKAANGTS